MVFARIVGETGTVLAQEIDADKLKTVVQVAGKNGLPQITPVLGQSDDPRLPDGLAHLIYMNRVFHHFAKPQAMLRRLWRDLRPGGVLVIVDQQKGPLTDWAPMESREDQHRWTGETTVVRLAREAGFEFHDVLDDVWHEPQPFVLAFRKPAAPSAAAGDPDLPGPLDATRLIHGLPLAEVTGAVAFCGLDGGRAVAPALRERLPISGRLFDVILDEWAISREELPVGAPVPGTEILRADKGNIQLPEGAPLGAVVFVDSYHRLWEPLALLRRLRERMPASGWVAVVDREGPDGESRRLAGHRRRVSAELVSNEMREAGFQLRRNLPAPTEDRYALLFERAP